MLTPSYVLHTIDYVYYKSDQLGTKRSSMKALEDKAEEEKEEVRQKEYRAIRKIKYVPKHLIRENEKNTAGYKDIAPKNE
jgi:hypothetical protein